MGLIRLKNRRRRYFCADLENQPKGDKQTFRTTLDPKTGIEGLVFHDYKEYEQLSLQYGQTSEPMDESVLKNASIQGAVRSGWLQLIRVK